jgi:hypothetical protein
MGSCIVQLHVHFASIRIDSVVSTVYDAVKVLYYHSRPVINQLVIFLELCWQLVGVVAPSMITQHVFHICKECIHIRKDCTRESTPSDDRAFPAVLRHNQGSEENVGIALDPIHQMFVNSG